MIKNSAHFNSPLTPKDKHTDRCNQDPNLTTQCVSTLPPKDTRWGSGPVFVKGAFPKNALLVVSH